MPRAKKQINQPKFSFKQRLAALLNVARTTFRASPSAVVIKLIGSIIQAVLPLVTAYYASLTTTALAAGFTGDHSEGNKAIVYVIVTATLGVLLTVWRSIERYIDVYASYRINAAVSDQLYRQFVVIEYWRYDDKATADMFDKAQNFSTFFTRFFDTLALITTALVQICISVIALLFINPWLALIITFAVVPGMLVQLRLSRIQSEHWKANVEKRRKVSNISWSVFQTANLAELRVYNVAQYMLNLRASLRDEDELERIRFERSFTLKRLGGDVLEAAAEVAILLLIAIQIINRQQPIGQFIYVQQLVSRTLSGMQSLISEISRVDEDLATMFDYEMFMELPVGDDGQVVLDKQPETIRLTDVSFSYPSSDTKVLKNVSFEIHKHQHIAIVGENGAGKSTLIKLIMGLYQPKTGKVLLDEVDLGSVKKSDWHSYLGVLQQDFIHYYYATAKENVLLGDVSRPASEERFIQAIEKAEAKSLLLKLPKKYDSYVNQWYEHSDGTPGVELSGGQWQRLALARIFYRDSPIIILDEPTSAIDALAESRIFQHLFQDSQRTIITISHRLTTIKKADCIYMMKDGVIVESGNYNELVELHGEFYNMFLSQIKQ